MTTATNKNVIHWQGNSRQIIIGPVMSDSVTPTAVRWWMAKRATSKGPDIFVMKSLNSPGGITLENNLGEWTIIIQLDPDDTENVPPGNWYHETEVIDRYARVQTLTIGSFTVNPALIPSDLL
jgi:hypothetical protein